MLAVVLAACSSDSGDGGTARAGDQAGSRDTAAASAGAGGLQLDEPVKIAFLWEITGESSAATSQFDNGAKIAVDAINAAGGIGGHPIETIRVPMPLDAQRAGAAYLQALDADPTVAIGFTGVTQLLSALSNVERGGVPVLATSSGDEVLRLGNDGGSEWSWILNPPQAAVTSSAVDFATGELGHTKVGLMGTNESYGTQSIADSRAALEAKGLEPYAERNYAPDATDLTGQVLAMKGSEIVLNWGYPNPLVVQLKQFEQAGLNIPTVTSASAGIVVSNGLISGSPIEQLYSVVPCNPSGASRPALAAFGETYQERYREAAGSLAAIAHDAVYVAAAAVNRAGSTDPAAVNEALGEVDVTEGVVCTSSYQADASHFMNHELVVVRFAADGTSTTEKTYELPPLGTPES